MYNKIDNKIGDRDSRGMANTPKSPQDKEAVRLIAALKEKLGCDTDQELADRLELNRRTILSDWRKSGLPKHLSAILKALL